MTDDNLPEALPSTTQKVRFGCGNVYVTVDTHEGRPARAFLRVGKMGTCKSTLLETVSNLVSEMLERGIPVDDIVHMLIGVRCDKGMVGQLSCVDVLAKRLREVSKKGGREWDEETRGGSE